MNVGVSLKDFVYNVNCWNSDRGWNLRYIDGTPRQAVWEAGNCLLFARRETDLTVEVGLQTVTGDPPNAPAIDAWNRLGALLRDKGWITTFTPYADAIVDIHEAFLNEFDRAAGRMPDEAEWKAQRRATLARNAAAGPKDGKIPFIGTAETVDKEWDVLWRQWTWAAKELQRREGLRQRTAQEAALERIQRVEDSFNIAHSGGGKMHSEQAAQGKPLIEVFFSYSHKDERFKDELVKHLSILKRQGVIAEWHDRMITAGTEWAGEIDTHLNTAHIILLLISANFLASDYCYGIELKRAMERHEAGEARVIPIILRPVDWNGAPFGKLQALPKDAKPVTDWRSRDKAFEDVAKGIRATIEAVRVPISQRSLDARETSLREIAANSRVENSLKSDNPTNTSREIAKIVGNPPLNTKRHLKQELLETLAQVFSNRRTIDPLVGEALHIRLDPSLQDSTVIFELVMGYCEANGGEYLARLLNKALEFRPQHQQLKPLRAFLVDNGSIPNIAETSIPEKIDSARLDETIPGGRYLVDGEYVDANGNPVGPPERYKMITGAPARTEPTRDSIRVVIQIKKQQRGFIWDRLRDDLQSTYGGHTFTTRPSQSEFAFSWAGMDKANVLRDAEEGKLDATIQAYGGVAVLEILEEKECLFNYIPAPPKSAKPSLTNVATDKLMEAFHDVDVLLLTTTKVEWEALRAQMLPWPREDGILQGFIHTRTYHLGQMGNYCVAHVASSMGSGGRAGAFTTALQALEETKPKAFILVGVAFGVDRKKQRLGDVLIAESVFPYELQRVGDQSSIQRGAEMQCGIVLSNRFRNLREDWELRRGPRRVNTFQGLILSGDKLIDNQEFRDNLLKNFPTAVGGEMEGWGAYAAAGEKRTEMILIKAICDWADGHKHDRAQPFAAYAAVSLVKQVLSKPDVLNDLGAREVRASPNDRADKDPPQRDTSIGIQEHAEDTQQVANDRSGRDLQRAYRQAAQVQEFNRCLRKAVPGASTYTQVTEDDDIDRIMSILADRCQEAGLW